MSGMENDSRSGPDAVHIAGCSWGGGDEAKPGRCADPGLRAQGSESQGTPRGLAQQASPWEKLLYVADF